MLQPGLTGDETVTLLIVVGLVVYLFPTIVEFLRGAPDRGSVLVLNVFRDPGAPPPGVTVAARAQKGPVGGDIGVDPDVPGGAELGSEDYLTAERRRELVAARDGVARPGR